MSAQPRRPTGQYVRIVFLERVALLVIPVVVLAGITLMVAPLLGGSVPPSSLTALSYLVWLAIGIVGGIAGGSGLSAWGGSWYGGSTWSYSGTGLPAGTMGSELETQNQPVSQPPGS